MNLTLNQEDPQLTYNVAAMATIELLLSSFMNTLPVDENGNRSQFIESLRAKYEQDGNEEAGMAAAQLLGHGDDKIAHVVSFSEGIQEFVNQENPYIDGGMELAKTLGLKWDEPLYKALLGSYSEDDFMENLKSNASSPQLMGLVSGLFGVIDILQDLKTQLENGGDVPSIYWSIGKTPEFFMTNFRDLSELQNRVLKDLKDEYLTITYSPLTDIPLLIESEIVEFDRLFQSANSNRDWSYLAKRMKMSEPEIELIYEDRNALKMGYQVTTFYSFDREQRLNYAILSAIQEYLSFLRSEINRPRLYESLKEKLADDRIMLSQAGRDFMESCFVNLAQSKDGKTDVDEKEYMMTTEDVNHLIQANFVGFGDPVERKLLDCNFENKTHLAYFIGQVLRPLIKADGCIIDLENIPTFLRSNFKEFESVTDEYAKTLSRRHIDLDGSLKKALKVSSEKYSIKLK